jgi:sugar phosphate isomerase/epimerase
MVATVRVAQKLGAALVRSHTGSSLWPAVASGVFLTREDVAAGLQDFVRRWSPVFDACQECGLEMAFTLRPGQIAFDLASAEMLLDAARDREDMGFALDPAQLHWQGIDPVEVVRRLGDRVLLVHATDAAVRLDGRAGLLNGYDPPGGARRGWDARSPGHGGVDWSSLIRALNDVRYDGPLAVDWADPAMQRDYGAEDACRFARRLDFDPAGRSDEH